MIVASRLGAIVAAAMPAPAMLGIALVRQPRGLAGRRARRLVRFAHFGLHQQCDVARDLSAGAGEDREGGCNLRQLVAMGVPRCVGRRQIEQGGEPLGHCQAVLAERRECPRGAAELQRQRLLAQPAQAFPRARQGRRVARELEPERHRQCVLQRGARHRGGAAMAAGDGREAVDGAVEVGDQQVDAGAQFEHERAVDQVLPAGAPMHKAGGFGVGLGHLVGERRDQRARDVAGVRGGFAQRREIVPFGLAGSGDRPDAAGGDRRHGGLGARQRRLEIQHALQVGMVVDDRPHRSARDQRREQRGGVQGTGHGAGREDGHYWQDCQLG
jgi:hypothetical protein